MVLMPPDGKRNIIRTKEGYAEANPIVNPFNVNDIMGFAIQFFDGRFRVLTDPEDGFHSQVIGKPFFVSPHLN